MTIEQAVIEKLRELPLDRQQEVLRFVESLQRDNQKAPEHLRRSLEGLWSDLDVHITTEDIAEARHEMWESTVALTE